MTNLLSHKTTGNAEPIIIRNDELDNLFMSYIIDYLDLECFGVPTANQSGYYALVRGDESVISKRFTQYKFVPHEKAWKVRLSGKDIKNESITGNWFI